MPKRHTPRRRRTSTPAVRHSRFSRRLLLEPLEDRRLLAVAAGFDFGDAPDPYPTTLADDGARHEAIGPTLGALRDEEADGQPSTDADGDGADEDGVTFGSIRVGQLDASVTVNVQNAPDGAKLDAWIDFNADGSWGGPGEQIADTLDVGAGDNTVLFDVPSWATDGDTYARFRLSTAGNLGMGGESADGEVEDHQVTIDPPAAATGLFVGQNVISTDADGARSVFAADVDGDGDIDVLSASHRDGTIAWYENDGSGRFTAHTISTDADGAISVFAADVDGDGDLDVLGASEHDSTITWYENDGRQSFTPHTISTDAVAAMSVFAADIDGDGDLDVLSASRGDNKIAWYENNGDETFTAHTISTDASGTRSVFAADVDGDGDIDVLSASHTFARGITWYENDGSGSFTPHRVSTGFGSHVSVSAADLDGDGDLDVLGATGAKGAITWYENDGNEGFTAHTISITRSIYSVFAADVDGDGDIDVLSASRTDDEIVWYENDGSGGFTAHTITIDADFATSVFAADIDGDGDLDVLSSSYTDDKIAWYESFASADFGDAPARYPTRFSDDGAFHVPTGPRLGAARDAEADGQPSADASGDGADEDGVTFSPMAVGQPVAFVTVNVQDAPAGARLDAWIDFNNDGTWGGPGEQIADSQMVTNGDNAILFDVPLTAAATTTFARFRLSTEGNLTPAGSAVDGEVEDYEVNILPFELVDFGDAPAPYPTRLSDGGAFHLAVGPTLGATRDLERDGQPTAAADGDGDDEDGVTFGSIRVGQLDASLTVNVRSAPDGAKLDAWIDLNGDGSWGGPGEQIADALDVAEGDNTVLFDVPSWAASGNTFARFRLSTAGDLGMGGAAADGEVEDYLLTIDPPAASPSVFVGQHAISDVRGAYSVFAADVDGDGDIDVLSAGGSTIAWHENDGNAGFEAHTISTDAPWAESVFAADVDGDGDIDVLSASRVDDKIVWYENDGNQGFTAHTINVGDHGARSVIAADVDGDGDIDVISASLDARIAADGGDDGEIQIRPIAWYENDGSEGFTAHTISTDYEFGASSVFAADVDGDGDIDLLSASYFDGRIAWHENDGSGNFTAHTIGGAAMSVFATDVDADGDLDVLGAAGRTITWYENDGSQQFVAHTITSDARDAQSVFAADIDGDGDIDVLSVNGTYRVNDTNVVWYENDGSQNFEAHTIAADHGGRSVLAADVDGDGDLDVVNAAAYGPAGIVWYENRSPVTPEPVADLTGNGFVDFEDLTVLLAAWNQDVSAAEGNLVDADTTPVNFEDLTVLLAAWTGPGAAGAPVGRGLAAAVGGDSVGDPGSAGPWVAVGDASYKRRNEAPRQAAAYGSATGVGSYGARRDVRRIRPAGGIYRLQAVAVDRLMGEEVMGRAMVGRGEGRRRR